MDFGLGVLLEAKDLFTGTFQRAGASFRDFEGTSSAAGARIQTNLKALGVGMALFGAGIAGLALLGPASEEAAQFAKHIDLVRTEVDEAAFSQENMKKITRGLALEFGRMPTDEADALYKAVALGANNAAKATDFMRAANTLAVAGNSELKVTADALGGALNAYGLQASDAGSVSDAFFTAMKNGNTTVQDLASSVGRVSSGAHEMGITVQEVLGAVSVMTNKGVQASEAVSYLHGALANIVHPTSDAKAEAQRLGIQFNAAAVRSKGFVEFMHSIAGNAKLTKDSLNKLFSSVEGSQAMAMLAGDIKAVDNVMGEMKKSAGATKAGFDIMSKGLAFQEEQLKAQKKVVLGLIGEAIEPMRAKTLGLVNVILSGFASLPDPVRNALVRFFAFGSMLLTVIGGAIALKAAIGIMAAGLAAAGVTFSGVIATMLPVVLVLGAIAAGFLAFREAYDRNLGGVGDFIDRFVDKVRLLGQALTQAFEDGGFSGAVREELNKADNQGLKAFAINVYVMVGRIQNYFSALASSFYDAINDNWPVFQKFMEAVDSLTSAFGSLFSVANPTKSAETFDAYGNAGKRSGAVLANVALIVVELATELLKFIVAAKPVGELFLDLVVACKPLISAFVDIVTWASQSDVAIGLLKDVLMAMAAVKIAGMAEATIAGIKGIASAAGVANASIAPFAAAVGALLLAYSQWTKLKAEWNDSAAGDMWSHFKNQVGIDSDQYYEARHSGITLGSEDPQAWKKHLEDLKAQHDFSPASTPAKPSTYASVVELQVQRSEMPAVASIRSTPGITSSELFAYAAAAGQRGPVEIPPIALEVKLNVDGEQLSSSVESASQRRADRGFSPGIPMSGG